MTGKLKTKGNMMLATKLGGVLGVRPACPLEVLLLTAALATAECQAQSEALIWAKRGMRHVCGMYVSILQLRLASYTM
jgi:hypothetical protein